MNKLLILAVGLTIILPSVAKAQSQQPLPPHIWGLYSNGMSAGVEVRPSDWPDHKGDFYCDIDVRNVTTNRLYIWVPSLDQRYEIKLLGPDGKKIRQLKLPLLAQRNPWLSRQPYNMDPYLERSCLDWFFLKDTFDIRTNGQFTLIVSVRANAFTNFSIGRARMQSDPTYFLLPPVTNRFNISTNGLKK